MRPGIAAPARCAYPWSAAPHPALFVTRKSNGSRPNAARFARARRAGAFEVAVVLVQGAAASLPLGHGDAEAGREHEVPRRAVDVRERDRHQATLEERDGAARGAPRLARARERDALLPRRDPRGERFHRAEARGENRAQRRRASAARARSGPRGGRGAGLVSMRSIRNRRTAPRRRVRLRVCAMISQKRTPDGQIDSHARQTRQESSAPRMSGSGSARPSSSARIR